MSQPLPGVPTRTGTTEDRLRVVERLLDELRQGGYGRAVPFDSLGNPLFTPDTAAEAWGIARPHLHVPVYPAIPNLGTAGYTWVQAWSATLKPLSQQINTAVRWSFQELPTPTNTGIGEYEIRWNKGKAVGARGEGINDSILMDSWDSGVAGSKGLDGSLIREVEFVWPQDGSAPLVSYEEPGAVTISVWARTRTATGTAADIARVVPMWCYQSGYQQE